MNTLISTTSKLSTLALSAVLTLSLAGAVIEGFASRAETTIVQLPTVVIIGHRDPVAAPDALQANAKPAVKLSVKSGA